MRKPRVRIRVVRPCRGRRVSLVRAGGEGGRVQGFPDNVETRVAGGRVAVFWCAGAGCDGVGPSLEDVSADE